MPDGQKWKVQWRGGRPVIPELEKWFNPRYGEMVNPDEEQYGVTINQATDEVILPTGERVSYAWWQTLSPQKKAEMTTGGVQINKQTNTVTLPSGRSFTLKAWQKMTEAKQKELTVTTPAEPTQAKWRVGGAVGAALRGEGVTGIENLTPEELMAYQSWMPYIQKAEEGRLDVEKIREQGRAEMLAQVTEGAQRYATAKWQTETPTGKAAARLAETQPYGSRSWVGRPAPGGGLYTEAYGGPMGTPQPEEGKTLPTATAVGFSPEGQAAAARYSMELDRRNAQLSELTGAFENARGQILRTTSPRDWVIRERARLAENPYAQFKPQSFVGGVASGRAAGEAFAEGMGGSGGPSWGLPPNYAASMPLSKEIEKMLNPLASEEMYGMAVPAGMQKFLGSRNPYGTQQQVQGVIPGWNPPFAQGRPNPMQFVNYPAGTFGTKVETPSMQGWASAPWTVREQLMGYLEAMGQQPADLLASMQRMQPNEPSRGTAWRPRLQYA